MSTASQGWHPRSADALSVDATDMAADIARRLDGWALPLLAVRTHHSALEGTRSPQAWGAALTALSPGVPAILADRDDLAALPAVLAAWGRERTGVGATVRWCGHDLILIAPEAEGYRSLCRLLTWRHREAAAAMNALPPAVPGLIALVRDPAAVAPWRQAGAEVWWASAAEPDDGPGTCPAAAVLVLSHLAPADRAADPVLAALRAKESRVCGEGADLGTLPAMRDAYAGHPDLIAAGRALAARCTYRPGGGWHMPPSLHADPAAELTRRAAAGALRRYGNPLPPAVRVRLAHELEVIQGKDFAGYILTVADLAAGRRTCGRGSGASSLVCYCLGITNVDPVRYRLLFERFLSPARCDPPDLDVDFPWDERDDVLRHALRTYGAGHVAAVANHLHLHRWSALRLVARAAGMADAETSRIRDLLAAEDRYGIPARLPAPWPELLAAAERVVEAPHHLGLHCGGIVITREPVSDLAPVHPAAKTIDGTGLPTLPWEKDGSEAMGLVKIDLLGNRSLAVVRDCLADLRELGIAIDEARWRPADDPLAQALVASGDTLGCFYIESPAMRQLNAKAGSGDFDRLVVHSSIIRPAASRWIATYLERLHEHRRTGRLRDEWFPHPVLRGLLSESYGILSYQEDVMLVARELAGFDDAGANALRKVLGQWGVGAGLTRFADAFRAGCDARGVPVAVRDLAWGMIGSFAGYSFCKAHSASYAMVSFQCAWLKAHHPAVFLARVVANQGGFYQPSAYLEEARRRGCRILGPCVLASAWKTAPEDAGAIRCGLQLVPRLSAAAAGRLVAERTRLPFAGLADLRRRAGLDSGQLDSLLRAGALDALTPDLDHAGRAWVVQALAAGPRPRPRLREAAPDDSWIDLAMARIPDADPQPPVLPAPDPRQVLRDRFAHLGFLPAHHPLLLAALPARRLRATDLSVAMAGRRLVVSGLPIARKQVDAVGAESVRAMSFATLEDESGLIETVWFPDVYRAWGALLDSGGPLRLEGRLAVDHGVLSLEVEGATALEVRLPVGVCRQSPPG